MYRLVYSLEGYFQTIHLFFSVFFIYIFYFITLYSNNNIYIYIVIKKGCIVCIVCIVFLKSLGEISKNNLGNNDRHFKLYIYTSIHPSFYPNPNPNPNPTSETRKTNIRLNNKSTRYSIIIYAIYSIYN